MAQIDRITLDPAVMGGKPCIRGLRVTVAMILGLLSAGRSKFSKRTHILKQRTSINAWPMRHGAWRNVKYPHFIRTQVDRLTERILPLDASF